MIVLIGFGLLGASFAKLALPTQASTPLQLSQVVACPALNSHPQPHPPADPPPKRLFFALSLLVEDWEPDADNSLLETAFSPFILNSTGLKHLTAQVAGQWYRTLPHSFSELNHAPLFIFLQVFRL